MRTDSLLMLGALAVCGGLLTGCRYDMQDQPKYKTYGYSKLFADGRNSRPIPPNTVARGELEADAAFYQGKVDGKDIDYFPIPITREVILRGQNRFDIYCSPCHGRVGNGLGMIVRRGLKQPPSYHIDRLRTAPVGHFYDVVTNGYGAMLNYAAQIQPRDRWAIIAYIRVLQFSQDAPVSELPAEVKANLPAGGNIVNPAITQPPIPGVVNPTKPMIPTNKPVPSTRPGAE